MRGSDGDGAGGCCYGGRVWEMLMVRGDGGRLTHGACPCPACAPLPIDPHPILSSPTVVIAIVATNVAVNQSYDSGIPP